jgi:hypothetical protein
MMSGGLFERVVLQDMVLGGLLLALDFTVYLLDLVAHGFVISLCLGELIVLERLVVH